VRYPGCHNDFYSLDIATLAWTNLTDSTNTTRPRWAYFRSVPFLFSPEACTHPSSMILLSSAPVAPAIRLVPPERDSAPCSLSSFLCSHLLILFHRFCDCTLARAGSCSAVTVGGTASLRSVTGSLSTPAWTTTVPPPPSDALITAREDERDHHLLSQCPLIFLVPPTFKVRSRALSHPDTSFFAFVAFPDLCTHAANSRCVWARATLHAVCGSADSRSDAINGVQNGRAALSLARTRM
jgi:hypothetical protein